MGPKRELRKKCREIGIGCPVVQIIKMEDLQRFEFRGKR